MSILRGSAISMGCRRCLVLVLLVMSYGLLESGTPGLAQEAVETPQPITPPLHPPPAPQEQMLSPVPQQFDWIDRQVPSNPLLESLLRLRRTQSDLFMSLTLAEQYSNNFERTTGEDNGSEENFRTSLTLGTVYRREHRRGFLSLANTLSAAYDTADQSSTIGFLNLSFNTGYDMARVSLALSDTLVVDDDAFGLSQGIVGRRTPFLTNTLSPQVRYALTPLTTATLRYTNSVVVDLDTNDLDSVTHAVTAGIQHRFNRRVNSNIEYTFQTVDERGNLGGRSDLDARGELDERSHSVAADLGWVLSRRVDLLVRLDALILDRSGDNIAEQRQTLQMNFGVDYRWASAWQLFVGIGPSYLAAHTDIDGVEEDDHDLFGNWEASLRGLLAERTALDISTSQSIDNTSGTVGASGLVLRSLAQITLNHSFLTRLQGSFFVTYGRNDFLENIDADTERIDSATREDQIVTAGLRASYPLTPVLSLSLAYQYEKRMSNDSEFDFDANRVDLTLSAGFDIFQSSRSDERG